MVLDLTWYLGQHSCLILTDTGIVANRVHKESMRSDTTEDYSTSEGYGATEVYYVTEVYSATEGYGDTEEWPVLVECANAQTYSLTGGGDTYYMSPGFGTDGSASGTGTGGTE